MPVLVATGCSSGLGLGALSLWCHRLVASSASASASASASRSRPSRWLILASQRTLEPSPLQHQLSDLCRAHPDTLSLRWLGPLDLAHSHSVRAFAREVKAATDRVDALVLNAATWTADADREAVEVAPEGGQWTTEAVVNALSQHLLVDLLSPLLASSSPSSSAGTAPRSRIVVTTSKLHSSVPSLDALLSQLHPPSAAPATGSSTGKSRYAASKALQLVSAGYWAAELADKGVDVVAVSPGFVPTTNLSRAQAPAARWALRHLVAWAPFAVSEEEGAARIARCFPSPEKSSSSSSSGHVDDDELSPLFRAARTPASADSDSAAGAGGARPLVYLTGPSSAPLAAPTGVSQVGGVAQALLERAGAALPPGGWGQVGREVLGGEEGWEGVRRWEWAVREGVREGGAVGGRSA